MLNHLSHPGALVLKLFTILPLNLFCEVKSAGKMEHLLLSQPAGSGRPVWFYLLPLPHLPRTDSRLSTPLPLPLPGGCRHPLGRGNDEHVEGVGAGVNLSFLKRYSGLSGSREYPHT